MTEPDRIAVETSIAAPFETVWHALRDPASIRRWHGWEYDGLDTEIAEIYLHGVKADEPAGTIAIAEGSRFVVEDHGPQTVVRVTMAAPAGDAGWEEFYDDIREGWTSFVHQLRFALERHPGEDRRTLQLDGAGPRPLVPAALGLDGAERAGEPYAGTTGWASAGRARSSSATSTRSGSPSTATARASSSCTPSRPRSDPRTAAAWRSSPATGSTPPPRPRWRTAGPRGGASTTRPPGRRVRQPPPRASIACLAYAIVSAFTAPRDACSTPSVS